MARVIALQGFDHGGPRLRGAEFDLSEGMAAKLKAKGLVRIVGDGSDKLDPSVAAGEPSSASQVAPASQQAIVSSSGSGGRRRKAIPVEPAPSMEQQTSSGVIGEVGLELISEQPQAEETLLEETQTDAPQQEVQSELL